jgi:DNA-binding transcriptional LysR family regulator
MDIKQLKCFATTAEVLHFGNAAQQLNMLPTTLGRQIKLLEESLGVRLFVRSTRHVNLTTAGNTLYRDAKVILKQVAATELSLRQLSKVKGGKLRIGAIDSAAVSLLPSVLCEFRERYPRIETELIECESAQQLQFLMSGHIDLGFIRPPVREDSLKYEFLFHETLMVAMPEGHALANKTQIEMTDLVDRPLIVPPRRTRSHSYRAVMRAFEAAGEEPKIVIEVSERQTVVSLVAAGVGIALVPSWVTKFQITGVVYRQLEPALSAKSMDAELGVAWSEDLRSPLCESFLDLVRNRLAL